MAESRRRDRMGFFGSLARGLAHEIKNPLSTLTVNLQMMREDLTEPLTSRERRILKRLETLEREVKRSSAILNDFLGLAGGFKLELAAHPIGPVLEDCVSFFEPEARRRHIQIRLQVDAELPDVLLDLKYFKQALLNLFINAQQAMADGGELLIRAGRRRSFLQLEIIDTGVGIPPENLARIWELYFSTKKGGSGLGLPTVRRIIEEHGGTIDVHSEPGKGTCFTLLIPLSVSPRAGAAPT